MLLLRGGGTHQYDLLFQNAGQLVKDDDVQIGGRRIGSIREITLTDDNRARVRVEVEEPYAPLHEGTQAVIRLTSLSGIANRYIALTPAPNSANELDDGATLAVGSTTDVVDLDQLFNTLDPDARKDLQGVIQGFATQYEGKGKAGRPVGRVLQPVPVDLAPARQPAHAGRERADATSSSTPRAPSPRWPSAATTSPTSSATRTRRRRAIARRERRARRRRSALLPPRCGAPTRRS